MNDDLSYGGAHAAFGRRTDWSGYRLAEVWQMVRDEDGRTGWVQDAAWRRMAQLCEDQADQLENALRQLTEAWPAHVGSASFAFKVRVDELVASMRDSVRAARANQRAIQQITYALTRARAEVASLVEEARQYAEAERDMIRYTHSASRWYPGPGVAAPPPAPPPEPPPNWKATLDQRARDVAAEADALVGTQLPHITVPRTYGLDPRITATSQDFGHGLMNGGASPRMSTMSLVQVLPSAIGSGPHNDIPSVADTPVLSGSPMPGDHPVKIVPVGEHAKSSGHGSSSGIVATPHGGVLMPPSSAIKVGNLSARPHPTGGATGRPTPTLLGPPMAPMVPPVGQSGGQRPTVTPGGRAAFSASHRRREAQDLDDPWAVPQGCPAVLVPPPEDRDFDPGPGVIGLLR